MAGKNLNITEMQSDDLKFVSELKAIVSTARARAYQAVDLCNVASNWLIGKRIVDEEQHGQERAQYGKRIIQFASEALTSEFGKGYSVANIKSFKKFYLIFGNLIKGQTVSAELDLPKLLPSNLSWSHYERLMRIKDDNERDWYMREAAGEGWSVRTLNRNIGSQYYYRLLQTPKAKRCEVIDEMHRLTADYQNDRHQFMRNPVVAEFLGFSPDTAYSESNLETAIINHLQKFIMELGKGYAFVARQ